MAGPNATNLRVFVPGFVLNQGFSYQKSGGAGEEAWRVRYRRTRAAGEQLLRRSAEAVLFCLNTAFRQACELQNAQRGYASYTLQKAYTVPYTDDSGVPGYVWSSETNTSEPDFRSSVQWRSRPREKFCYKLSLSCISDQHSCSHHNTKAIIANDVFCRCW